MQDDGQALANRREILTGLGAGSLFAALPGCANNRAGPFSVSDQVDLTGGLAPQREYFLTEASTVKGFADAASFRLWDDHGRVAFSRLSIDAISPETVNRMQMSLVFPDGRVLRNFEPGTPHPMRGDNGLARIIGAGPLRFECVEPFRHHRLTFSGTAIDTTYQALAENQAGDRRVDLEFEIECYSVAPPWEQGSMLTESDQWTKGGEDRRVMGGDRFEQLMRAVGRIKIGGIEKSFSGGALRSRRQGVRDIASARGYCYQSATFPSGRSFGYMTYPPRDGETESYNEGYIYTGSGKIIPARVISPHWLERMEFGDSDVGLTLESALGRVQIQGRTVMSTPVFPTGPGLVQLQSIAKFRWGNEIAYGLTDRGALETQLPPTTK